MDHTYAEALTVVAWVGDDIMDVIAKKGRRYQGHPNLSLRLWPQVESLLPEQSYWERTWIVQELRLARDVQIPWGKAHFLWDDLAVSGFANWKLGDPDGIEWIRRLTHKGPKACVGLRTASRNTIDEDDDQEFGWKLGSLLIFHGRTKCRDLQDHVFAMLGMLHRREQDVLRPFFPDYSMSYPTVMLVTMVLLKLQGKALGWLDNPEFDGSLKSKLLLLPSRELSWRERLERHFTFTYSHRLINMKRSLWKTLSLEANKYVTRAACHAWDRMARKDIKYILNDDRLQEARLHLMTPEMYHEREAARKAYNHSLSQVVQALRAAAEAPKMDIEAKDIV